MFKKGDLVRHHVYKKVLGIVFEKKDRSCDDPPVYAYRVLWADDGYLPTTWELSQNLILAARVDNENRI